MSALNYNRIMIAGHLSKDPELRQTQAGKSVATYSVAVKKGTDDADFFDVVSWEAQAEFVCRYFKKGSAIFVEGEIHNRKWEDKNGNKRVSAEITARNVLFVDGKADAAHTQQSAEKPPKNEPQEAEQIGFANAPTAADFEDVRGDDDLPF